MSLSLHPTGPPKVIVSFVDGRGVGGFLLDFVPWEPRCRIVPSTRSREDETTPIDLQEVKGLYFVKDFHDLETYDREYPSSEGLGQKLEIVFCDEDRLIGRTYDFNPHQMGFFVSLDDGEGDSIRVFVINRNIRQVRRARTAQDRMETTTDAQGLSLNLRRSPRVTKEVALRAVWMDHRGRLQSETTATQVVNAHGAHAREHPGSGRDCAGYHAQGGDEGRRRAPPPRPGLLDRQPATRSLNRTPGQRRGGPEDQAAPEQTPRSPLDLSES